MNSFTRQIPNLLTAVRLALTPYLFLLLWRREYRSLLWPFALIAATDVADGFLARRFGWSTRLGAVLDPIADKVLMSGSFLVLALTRAIPVWLAVIVLGRDILILAAAAFLYLRGERRSFPPSIWGKLSTFIQVLYVMFAMGNLAGIPVAAAVSALAVCTAALALISLGDYARRMA